MQFTLQTGLKYFGIKYPLDYSGNASTGKEKIVHTEGDVWGKLDNEQRVGIRFEMDNLFYSSDSLMGNYTSLGLNPYYMLESDDWRGSFGVDIDRQSGGGMGL